MPFTTGVAALDRLCGGLIGDPLCSHPKIDAPSESEAAERGTRLVIYGYRAKWSPKALRNGRGCFDTELTLYEFDETWRAQVRRGFDFEGFALVHDFVVTEHYYVFFQNPNNFDPIPFALGQKNPGELINFDASRPTVIHVVPRDPSDGRRYRAFHRCECFVFHQARGYEQPSADGRPG